MAKLLLGSVVGPQGPQGTAGADGAQGPQGIAGPSEITAATDVVGLTPGRLLYNNGGKVGSVDIVDNLLSIDPYKPLSANQGKILKGLIDDNGSAIGQKADSSDFVATFQPLVVGSGFETQTGAVPFNVTKSGQMLYFIGQLKCLANTTSSPVVLATSPIPPAGYFYLNILVNGVRQEGLTIAPGTGQIYIYKPFSANDIITFNGFAIGDI